MASVCIRMKWRMLSSIRKAPVELWILVFIVLLVLYMASLAWEATRLNEDGRHIDVSPARQQQLIQDYLKEQEWLRDLKERELELKRQRGELDEEENSENDNLGLVGHRKKIRDPVTKSKPQKQNPIRTKTKEAGDKKGNPRQDTEGWIHEKQSDLVKFFDPVQDEIVYKKALKGGELQGGYAKCRLYDTSTYINEDYECISLSIRPTTPICLYPDAQDIHVSRHLRQDGIWEPHIVKEFQNILYGDSELAVIDIGANIGEYSLLAAVMGHKVVSVEPYIENLKHIHQAVRIANISDRIIAIQNAVSDTREIFFLKMWSNNQGGGSLQMRNPNPDCEDEECRPPKAWTIYMDDLLEVVNFKKAIIKIDIEGHEHRAFRHCQRLLDQIYVPYIFMEWLKLKSYYGSEITESEDKDLTHNLVDMLTAKGYTPYAGITMEKLTPGFWFAWPDDVLWKHELAMMA